MNTSVAAGRFALALVLVLAHAENAAAQPVEIERSESAVFTADEVTQDRNLDTITARGNVEVTYAGRTLLTDVLSYNRRDDVLTASGRVAMHEPTGEVLFARHVELSGDLKNGIIEDLRIVLQDGARIAANGGRRTDGNITTLARAVYSPCRSCEEDPSRPLLWKVTAETAAHDKQEKRISYEDVWLELAGVPVAYTPYLAHPDPTVKRQSGFLVPSFGSSSDLGFIFQVPYFWVISEQADATLEPLVTTNEGLVLAGEYRHRFMESEFDLDASLTRNSDNETLGHIDGAYLTDINDTWRGGLQVQRVSGETYRRRYGFGNEQTMTTHLYAEGFRKRNVATVDAFAFQGLTSGDDPGETPYVLPLAEYRHVGEPGRMGGRTELDLSFLSLFRTEGRDVRRLSGRAGWKLPYTGRLGDRYVLSADLRGDLYHVTGHSLTGRSDTYSGFTGRAVPQVALDWRFPLVRQGPRVHQLIEPIASVVVSPYGGNSEKIPNEDSTDFEFDESNLFSSNRFTGLDRVEGGPRVNYGMKWGIFGGKDGQASAIIGQSFRWHEDTTFADNSGLEERFSDIVASLSARRGDTLALNYRTLLAKEDFSARRNELQLSTGVPAFKVGIEYAFIERLISQEFATREELVTSLSSQLTRHWRANALTLIDLADDNDLRSFRTSLTYEDECLVFSVEYLNTRFRDRELQPSDSIYFRINFKTLGEVGSQLY